MGARRVFKRLILSLIGGFALPFIYTIIAGPLSNYTKDENIRRLLLLPIIWPRYAYVYFYPSRNKPPLYFDDTASLVTMLACDVAAYALVTYLLLWLFSNRKSKLETLPPPPPDNANQDARD